MEACRHQAANGGFVAANTLRQNPVRQLTYVWGRYIIRTVTAKHQQWSFDRMYLEGF
jgi:hypothetical protein